MPTYNLLEARNLANRLLDDEQPALITQVSENRFQVEPATDLRPNKIREKFVYGLGFIQKPRSTKKVLPVAIATFISIAVVLLFLLPQSFEGQPAASSDLPASSETLSNANLELLVAQGQVQQGATTLIETKRIDLGGYQTLLVNVNTQQTTKLVRIDLLKGQSGWEIEKWVELD